ncbi:hypothetical protein SAMN02745221_00705 [Thermosyntropha lipolytica DSM 11003]|uniref:Flp pilus-assembly TadG-like N-terminal domain-containing protein n=1 Tax=Thermosyntropha lipolytica DSM 11003 TaxID=1123382 RepID=A0A1M5LM97_9FIRM|nr:PilX N-terminal domain-containing pilus assembly protein [Thermosyntropha lipolytica]SHG66178.1 hypothetical protein SAMN02745221_00705 [Thermosyntropha lipolytica DSM 11003]
MQKRRKTGLLAGEEGQVMVFLLLILLVLAIMGTAVLSGAEVEHKMALTDTRVKKAQNAADSGVEIVRDFFIRELKGTGELNQTRVNAIKNRAQDELINASPIMLPDGSRILIKKVDVSRLLSYGEVDLVVVGMMGKASRKVTATLSFNTLPVKAVHADKLRIVGTYYLVSDSVPWNIDGYGAGMNAYEAPRWPYVKETAYTIGYGDGNSNIGRKAFWWTDGRDELVLPLIGGTGLYKIHYAPYYRAQGKVLVDDPAEIWFNNWLDDPGPYRDNLFYPGLDLSQIGDIANPLKWGCVRHEPARDYSIFRSRHFVENTNFQSLSEKGLYRKPPEFTEEQLQKLREIAKKEAGNPQGNWAYINNGSNTLYIFALRKPYTFVELPAGEVLHISFGVPPGANIIDGIRSFFYTVISLFTKGVPGVMLVTPADVKISFSNDLFNMINELEMILGTIFPQVQEARYLFITPGSISITYGSPISNEDFNIYALAGRDVNIVCEEKPLNFFWSYNHGSFNAGNNVNIILKHEKDIIWGKNQTSTNDRTLKLRTDAKPVESFQERWNLIGIGRITAYKVENGT